MRPPRPAVRDARPEELAALARCLARAFETDPVTRFLFPDARVRARRSWRFFRMVARELGPHGRVLTCDGLEAAAIWRAPGPRRPGRVALARSTARFLWALGPAAIRGRAFFAELERAHLRGPHWYLSVLGTDPAARGRGLGAALMHPILVRCDREGVRAYLESSKPENVPYYERHGFEVMAEVRVPGAPPVWPMRREPRGGA